MSSRNRRIQEMEVTTMMSTKMNLETWSDMSFFPNPKYARNHLNPADLNQLLLLMFALEHALARVRMPTPTPAHQSTYARSRPLSMPLQECACPRPLPHIRARMHAHAL